MQTFRNFKYPTPKESFVTTENPEDQMRSNSIVGLVAFAGAGFTEAATCNAKNCLRAVRNPDRPGSADCSSFFKSTVTPPVVTITAFSTSLVTAKATLNNTLSLTFFDIATVVAPVTVTVTAAGTTSTVVSYDPNLRMKKRQATSLLPAYATPCSNAAAYSSACSCIGVSSPIIVSAPTPSTTITLPSTVTAATSTVTVTVQTVSTTLTTATVTAPTTVATETAAGPLSTVTVTQPNPIPPQCRGNIILYNGLHPVDFSLSYATPVSRL